MQTKWIDLERKIQIEVLASGSETYSAYYEWAMS
jgi:hypothetical protein